MEASMYEDGSFNNYSRENPLNQVKRRLTLDLNSRPPKKQRAGNNTLSFNPLLTSPDLNQLKLASPELERLIIQQGGGILGNAPTTPSQFYFPNPKPPSEEQEEFAKGFEVTLQQLHHQNDVATSSGNVVTSASSISSHHYAQLDAPPQHHYQLHHQHQEHQLYPISSTAALLLGEPQHSSQVLHVKEEPQTVPSVGGTPPLSPIDMESQERIKLERKRLRNRLAASKCRARKLERIGKLEEKVNKIKNENADLQAVVNKLRDQVCQLKQEVMEHVNSGCQIPFVTHQ